MQISEHFSLAELTRSDTAVRLGLANSPDTATIAKLQRVCHEILEPVRLHFGKPVTVRSGYRSAKVNKAVGSGSTSQHVLGEAVDFEIAGVANGDLAAWCRKTLPRFGQLILESYRPGEPASGWVHCSLQTPKLVRQVMTMTMGSHGPVYSSGLRL